ncbi:MAG TPA: hypothetical protein VKB88_32400 [Bryobacteraceae bacterium]|nr:hypothetical protein [Bryobacteraceae bacterium]
MGARRGCDGGARDRWPAPSGVNDAALKNITRQKRLTRLDVGGATEITDDGMARLAQLPRLADLSLSGG